MWFKGRTVGRSPYPLYHWTLRDAKEDVVDYEHFTYPFILTVDEMLGILN